MEREADRGGQMLAAAAGYDPMGMSSFLRDMGNVERLLVGHARMPTFLDTHPTSQERAASNAVRARENRWRRDPALGDTRTAHLRRIDGMALDQRPEAGVFVGDDFLHPDMRFRLRFPHGWMMSNQNQAVGAVSPRRDAIIFMSADQPEGDPQLAAQLYLEQNREELKLELQESLAVKVGAIDAWRMQFKGSSPGGPLIVVTVFIPHAGVTFRITAMTLARLESQYRGRFLSTARSFRPLGASELRSIETRRLRLATARPGEDLTSLSRRTGNAWDANTTAVYNSVFIDHRYEGGELVKIAHVEPYVARVR
jgi:predicted Zn-dependent protease